MGLATQAGIKLYGKSLLLQHHVKSAAKYDNKKGISIFWTN
jgi:hypothetical protein